MRNRLACTVGTSLLSNIRGEYRQGSGITEEAFARLKGYLETQNIASVAKELVKLGNPHAKICGAEINSIQETVEASHFDLEHLYFLISDTDEGRLMGKLLETYFIERGLDGLKTINIVQIDELQDNNPKRFKTHGLRNLVRKLGELVRSYTAEGLMIDATGGYKAQIAIAVVFGQALQIPVLYRHERFSEIINFPPMPISFDYKILGENSDLLARFEAGETLDQTEFDELDEKVRVLLEEVDVEDDSKYVTLFALGAVGQIFLEGFRLRFPRDRELKSVLVSEKKEPIFSDDHFPTGFKEFVVKLWRDIVWIKSAHSVPYHGQRGIKRNGAYVREGKLFGTYVGKNNFGARFEIVTNAQLEEQLTWAADQINQYLLNNQ